MDIDSEIYTLRGNFDLILLSACNMSCKGCSYLDYLDEGCVIDGSLTLDDVKKIVNKLLNLKLKLQRLTMLGGEPSIHKQFFEIVEYLHQYKNIIYDELKVVTNGLFFNEKFLKSLDYLDSVRISIYPMNKKIEEEVINSDLGKYIQLKCNLEFHRRDTFQDYTKPLPGFTGDEKWNMCWKKKWCRVLTFEGIYRCHIAYNDRTEICDFSSREKLINYIENETVSLKKCETCPLPCQHMKWESNNEKKDRNNIEKGIKLIKQWKTTINLQKYKKL